jgi:hypothetical protein
MFQLAPAGLNIYKRIVLFAQTMVALYCRELAKGDFQVFFPNGNMAGRRRPSVKS